MLHFIHNIGPSTAHKPSGTFPELVTAVPQPGNLQITQAIRSGAACWRAQALLLFSFQFTEHLPCSDKCTALLCLLSEQQLGEGKQYMRQQTQGMALAAFI